MIVRMTGKLVEVTKESVILDRDGISREVLTPPFAIVELAAYRGQEVTLHTLEFYEGNPASGQLVPRILGFLHAEDKLFFSRFVSVKGFGPRKALKALSEPVRRIAGWIEAGQASELCRLPGVGKRAAELIIASLKGKLGDLVLSGAAASGEQAAQLTQSQRDALEIMVGLGDARSEAERWLARAAQLYPDLTEPQDWVRAAYRVRTGVEG